MKHWIWILMSASLVFGQQRMTKKIEFSDENGREKKIEVTVEIDNGTAEVEVTRNGDTETFEFPIDKLNEPAIQKKLAELGVDAKDFEIGAENDDSRDDFMGQFSFLSGPKSFLGVQLQELTDQLRTYFKLDSDGGVLVSEVVNDSPAEKAKLRAGDIILQVNDVRISDVDELQELVGSMDPGTIIKITYLRSGKEKTTRAELEAREGNGLAWFGKGVNQWPSMPGLQNRNFMFFQDDEPNLDEDFQEELKSMRKELNELRKQLDDLRNQ
ncbi:MAG: PDZ domain-containing protein [FCB group bacterium]|nr:PDZ domain-containing protein [FCB group bacterium]